VVKVGDPVTIVGTTGVQTGRVDYVHAGLMCFSCKWRVSWTQRYNTFAIGTFYFNHEGIEWVRGHHAPDSVVALALLAADALVRPGL
jgi:hypothetical protein